MAKNRLNIILGVDVKQLERQLNQAQRKMKRFASGLQSTGQTLTQSLTVPLIGIGGGALAAFGQIEKLEKGLTAILGPGADVRKELEALREAAEAPGLSFEQAVKGSIQLQSVGFSAEQARKSISALGTAVALTGGSAIELASVTKQITQINAKGRILQEDLGVIQENAPAIGIALKEAFGTQTAEGLQALNISAAEFTTRLTAAIENSETFQGVTGGLANAFENFRNNVKFAAAELGRTIAGTVNLEDIMNKLSSAVSRGVNFFKSLTPEAQRFIIIAATVAAAIGPVLIVLGKLIAIGPILVGAIKSIVVALRGLGGVVALITSPVTLVTLGIIALVAVIVAANEKFLGFRKVLNGVIDFLYEFYRIIVELAKPIGNLVSGLGKFFNRDFAGAAANITAAFKREIPSITDVGQRLGLAFAGGFADETNRVDGFVENLKSKIFNQVQDIAPILTTPTLPDSAPDATGGATDATQKITVTPEIQFLDADVEGLGEFDFSIDETAVFTLDAYREGLEKATEASRLFGATAGEVLQEKLNYTVTSGRRLLLDEGYTPQSEAVQTLMEQYNSLGSELDILNEKQGLFAQQIQAVSGVVGSVLTSAFDGFFQIIEQGGKNAFEGFVQGAKKALVNLVKQLTITLAKAVAVAAVMSIIFPGSTATAGGFKAIFGSVFSGIPLATGGIIPPGYPNDTFPARLSSGEAVIPLDKLNRYTGAGGGTLEARISGEDLLILMKQTETKYNRFS